VLEAVSMMPLPVTHRHRDSGIAGGGPATVPGLASPAQTNLKPGPAASFGPAASLLVSKALIISGYANASAAVLVNATSLVPVAPLNVSLLASMSLPRVALP